MKREPQNRRISNIQPEKVGRCAVCVLSILLVLLFGAIVWASCDHTISQITFSNANAPIHTTDGNYYRGEIHTFDKTVGICTVTAYLSYATQEIAPWNTTYYTLKLWGVDDNDNMTTLLATSQDVYLGGNWTLQGDDNWTRTRKTFHFYNPIRVPAGRVAITVSDGNSTAHPTNYHAWNRAPAVTGTKACSWTATYGGNCTDEYSQMMEVKYVEAPFLTANPYCFRYLMYAECSSAEYPHMGWVEIPEWSAYGLNMCEMDDNMTVACELPDAIKALPGNHKIKARFLPPDGNVTNASHWSHLRYRITDSGGTDPTITNHSHGDYSATITGGHN